MLCSILWMGKPRHRGARRPALFTQLRKGWRRPQSLTTCPEGCRWRRSPSNLTVRPPLPTAPFRSCRAGGGPRWRHPVSWRVRRERPPLGLDFLPWPLSQPHPLPRTPSPREHSQTPAALPRAPGDPASFPDRGSSSHYTSLIC